MKDILLEWSRHYLPLYNQLSEKYHTPFYNQSPLNEIDEPIQHLFIGINPAGQPGSGITLMTPEEFLKGNPCWEDRFVNGICKWKYNIGARFFMGYDKSRHPDTIDNDQKVVWTNLSPFVSAKGFKDLPAELRTVGIQSLIALIKILRPQSIVLLGGSACQLLDQNLPIEEKKNFTHQKVFSNQPFEIGRLYNIPVVYTCHPSQRWSVKGSHYFIPMLIHLHQLIDTVDNGNPTRTLQQVVDTIRQELHTWNQEVSTEL